ncbi:glycosyltransferase [Methylococcus capsulatus]|uniref:glycosyltransferase n=1 Tax=Methylococcus capsulatus TaxID=414 RepID=UPI001C52AC4C|nr:glycosyltransferase [Methylococcus capsulatus]QXP91767.1 glycosyltransferase [Methylococcus capsulatus]
MSSRVPAGKPRLLVILPADVIGGAETVVFNLLAGLRGFDCVLLTQSAIADFYRGCDIRLYLFDDWRCGQPYRLSVGNGLRYAWAIRSVVRRERPNLVLSIMHNGTFFASLAKRLFFSRIPLAGTILGSLTGYFTRVGRKPTLLERWVIHCCLTLPDRVIVPSYGVFEDLVDMFGAQPGRLKVIYNGIDVCGVRRKAEQPIELTKDRSWIVSASRFSSQKDFPTLLAAFKDVLAHRPARLVLVGDGELRQDIERIASDLGIREHVVMVGFRENPFPYMAQADIFVLSSFFEGFGNVIVEAMALGVPVVASDCPSGPAEIISDGENGFLVPVGDARALADRCVTLLSDDERRSAMVRSGLDRADYFSVGAMLTAFDGCLNEMLTGAVFDESRGSNPDG